MPSTAFATFHTNCPDGSHFSQMGLILLRIPPPTPVLYSAITHPFQGNVRTHNTLKAQAHPKTPFLLACTWKWAKCTAVWAIWIPTGQTVWKRGKTFLEVGKKKNLSCAVGTNWAKLNEWRGEISIVQSIQLGFLSSPWLGSATQREANKSAMRRTEWTITARRAVLHLAQM